MPDTNPSADAGVPPPPRSDSTTSGLKRFNSLTEEPAREILKPQVDPAVRRRTLIIGSIAAIIILILAFLVVSRNPDLMRADEHQQEQPFAPPARDF